MARKGRRSSKDERIDAIRLLEQGYTKVQVARVLNALPLISGTSAAGCPIRGCVLQVCHDAVCESSRALSASEAPGMTQLGV
jgi:hypothetical protein